MFGRRKVPPPSPPVPPPAPPPAGGPGGEEDGGPGHQALLGHLAERERDDPGLRERVVGSLVFDQFVADLAEAGGRVRIEDLIAVLASIGGHLCLVAAMAGLAEQRLTPQQAGLLEVEGRDGHRYYFGDLPNRLLIEDPDSLLGLVLGAARAQGAEVSLDMVQEAMKRTAARVGGEEFGVPDLPDLHRSTLSPFDWVKHGRGRMAEALDLYRVPPLRRPCAVGYALQRAVVEGRQVLDPAISARIAVECSVPMAKVDPTRFAA